MKKNCKTCFAKCERYQNEEEKKDYCQYYECFCDEIIKSEEPECWETFHQIITIRTLATMKTAVVQFAAK